MTFILGTLVVLAMLAVFVGGVMVLIAAFRESVWWGLGSLVIPFVSLIFVITHWQAAKRGFLIGLGGNGLLFALVFLIAALDGPDMPDAPGEPTLVFQDDGIPQAGAGVVEGPAARRGEAASAAVQVAAEPLDFDEILEKVEEDSSTFEVADGPAQGSPSAAARGGGSEALVESRSYVAEAAPARPASFGPQRWPELVGQRIEVVQRGGSVVSGVVLLAVEADRLTLRRKLGGGTMDFDIARSKVEAIRPER